jgi:hypothetical protein
MLEQKIMAHEESRDAQLRELVGKIEEEERYLRSRLPSDVDRVNGALIGWGSLGVGVLLAPITGGVSLLVGLLGANVGNKIHQDNSTEADVSLRNERIAQSALLKISDIKSLLVQDKFEIALHEWGKYERPIFKTWSSGMKSNRIMNEK